MIRIDESAGVRGLRWCEQRRGRPGGCASVAAPSWVPPGERSYLQCLGPDAFVQDVFMDSDTELMVLSFVPSTRAKEPLTIEEAAAAQAVVAQLEGSKRLFLHGRVNPNQPGDIADMRRLRDDFGICAWKTYTQWGPEGVGYALDDPETGIPFLERARELGVRRVAVHKGIPFGRQSYQHSLCDDIGRVARRFPDIDFLVYHAGFVPGQPDPHFRTHGPTSRRQFLNLARWAAGGPL